MIKIPNEVIFNTLRILKGANQGDLYYENYLGHLAKRGDTFMDTYHVMWQWAIEKKPKRILEIGVRSGISICQLLSAFIHKEYEGIERIVLCDVFSDSYCSPELVKYNLSYLNIPQVVIDRIEFLVGDSKREIAKFVDDNPNQMFDYILVDGSHEVNDAINDLENTVRLVDTNGMILFDDITPDGVNLQRVWDAFKKKYDEYFDWWENHNGKGVAYGIRNAVILESRPCDVIPTVRVSDSDDSSVDSLEIPLFNNPNDISEQVL